MLILKPTLSSSNEGGIIGKQALRQVAWDFLKGHRGVLCGHETISWAGAEFVAMERAALGYFYPIPWMVIIAARPTLPTENGSSSFSCIPNLLFAPGDGGRFTIGSVTAPPSYSRQRHVRTDRPTGVALPQLGGTELSLNRRPTLVWGMLRPVLPLYWIIERRKNCVMPRDGYPGVCLVALAW